KMGANGPESFLRNTYVKRINNRDTSVTNDNPRIQVPTGFTQMNAMQKIRFKPNKIWDINYDFHYSETSEYSRYDRHLRTEGGEPRYGEWKYGPQTWMMNNLYVINQGENWLWDLATFKIAHQRFEESRISRAFNDDIRNTQEEVVDAFSLNMDFNNEIKTGKNLFYGIEVINNQVNSTAFDLDISTKNQFNAASRYPKSEWASYSAYASYDYDLTEKLMIQAGTRYTIFQLNADFDTTFYPFDYTSTSLKNDAWTGNIGLTYQTKTLTIGASSSTGFRAPNVDDIGKLFDSEPGAVVIPNPFLKAEYAFNQELSIEKIINKKIKVNTTVYYTYLKDAMVRRDDQLGDSDSIMYDGVLSKVQSIQNAAYARVYGLQFSIEGKISREFGFHSYLSFQNGIEELEDESISPSRHAAPWFGSTHVDYSINHLKIDLSVDYSGNKAFEDMPESEIAKDYLYDLDENGNPYAAGWAIVNLKGMYNVNSNVALTGGIENILNKRYKTYSSGLVAPGRNLILALRVSF
ncbi:MAG: hemoglobin/transferrin/lactoferrin receptor protein, partial [Saprospiraceae bacterium]